MPTSFGQRPRTRKGGTATVATRKRIVQVPVKWMASLIGREPRSGARVRSRSHRAGRTAPTSAASRSDENAPVLSRQSGMRYIPQEYAAIGMRYIPQEYAAI